MVSTNGHRATNAEAQPQPDNAARWQRADKVKSKKFEWLLPNRIILGGLSIVEGETSAGKSTFLAHLAAAVSTGEPWIDRGKSTPRNVLWFAGEEDFGGMIAPRLKAAGANMKRIHIPADDDHDEPQRYELPGMVRTLRNAIDDLDLALVIIEPLASFVGQDTDLNNVTSVRSILDPLQRLALAQRCCVIMSRGLRKDRSGPRTSWGQGSAAIGDTARCILQIDCPDQSKGGRVLRCAKTYGSKRPPDLACAIRSTSEGPVMGDFRTLSSAESLESESVCDLGERSVRADARRMLRKMLSDGWVRTTTILAAGADAGISPNTLRRAQAELGVITKQSWDGSASYWEWGPPEGGLKEEEGGAVESGHLGKRADEPTKKARKPKTQIPRHPDTQKPSAPPGETYL